MLIDYIISQQEAFEAIQKKKGLQGLGLSERDLCGPSAFFTGLNFLFRKPIYTPENVALFYLEGMKLHGKKHFLPAEWQKKMPQGWLLFTPDKQIYHHALLWAAHKEGVVGENIEGKIELAGCQEFIKEGGVMLLSVPNKITEWRTGERLSLKPGTHLILWWKTERETAFLIDPYWKKPEPKENLIFAMRIDALQKIWEKQAISKALAFSLFKPYLSLLPFHSSPKLFIPPTNI